MNFVFDSCEFHIMNFLRKDRRSSASAFWFGRAPSKSVMFRGAMWARKAPGSYPQSSIRQSKAAPRRASSKPRRNSGSHLMLGKPSSRRDQSQLARQRPGSGQAGRLAGRHASAGQRGCRSFDQDFRRRDRLCGIRFRRAPRASHGGARKQGGKVHCANRRSGTRHHGYGRDDVPDHLRSYLADPEGD